MLLPSHNPWEGSCSVCAAAVLMSSKAVYLFCAISYSGVRWWEGEEAVSVLSLMLGRRFCIGENEAEDDLPL